MLQRLTTPTPATILHLPAGESTTSAIRPYRARRGYSCPVCGKDSECIIIPAERQPGHTHVWCTRTQSEAALTGWGFKGNVYYFYLDDATGAARIFPHPQRRQIPLASAATMDRALRETAQSFGLTDAHRALLARRGYDVTRCGPDGHHAFASLPDDAGQRAAAASRLMAAFATESDVLGTLGYSRDRRRGESSPIAFLGHVAGGALIEFRRDASGRFSGFQYAPDTPETDSKGKPKKRLSPTRMIIADHCHVAQPTHDTGAEVWHTEGIHKANLTADHRQAVALGALGVGNVSGLTTGARVVDPEARRLHIIALDADYWGKKEETELATRLHDAGYRVALARWDAARGNGPDDALVAGAPITIMPYDDPRPKPRQDQRITHAHAWQRTQEAPGERHAQLSTIGAIIRDDVLAHIDSKSVAVLIEAAPPGVGKSYIIATIGERTTTAPEGQRRVAWVAQNHAMHHQVQALITYREIMPPSKCTCPTGYKIHEILAPKGYNTRAIHAQHTSTCAYLAQFNDLGSTFFQLAHLTTPHPARRDAIILDEMDVPQWLPARPYTIAMMSKAAQAYTTESFASRLLVALQHLCTDASGAGITYEDKAFFDALDARCGGQLAAWIGALERDDHATNPRPWIDIDIYEQHAAEFAESRPSVVLPHIWRGLAEELALWQRGEPWNGRIGVGPYADGQSAIYITQPLGFTADDDGHMPPRICLDATADEEIHRRVFGTEVIIHRPEVTPPAHMQHIAVRSGKRYGKMSLTPDSHERDRARVIAELRYLLADLDPDGELTANEQIGLVTFKGCEAEIGAALGIPARHRLHFWATRGKNDLEDCAILLVVGTPALNPAQVRRMARALYRGEERIDDTPATRDDAGVWTFADPRCQHLADYLVRAELTQCAHRNRPLRHDGRIVVTLCQGDIDYLPITTEVISLPTLTVEGAMQATKRQQEAETRMTAAATALRQQGQPITARAIAAGARIQMALAAAWVARQRHQTAEGYRSDVTENTNRSIRQIGNITTIAPPPVNASADPPAAPPLPDVVMPAPRLPRWARVEQLQRYGLSEYEAIRQERIERQALAAQEVS